MTHARRLDRTLLLLPSVALGGAEAHAATLARALHQAGVAVRLAIDPPLRAALAASLPPTLAPDAAPLAWVQDAPTAANLGRQAAAAAQLIAAHRPDVVILPLPWPNLGLGILRAAAAAGVPVLAIAHLVPHAAPTEAQDIAAAPPTGAIRWVAVATPTARRLEALFRLPTGTAATVPNGIAQPAPDPDRAASRAAIRGRLGLPPGAPLLLFAGRLAPEKGADLLLRLAALLHARLGTTLAVLGTGPLAARLRPADPDGPLRLLGQVSDVAPWMRAADALLLPSRLEGCPLVALEAAVHHLPVVATAAALEAYGEAAPDFAAVLPATAPATDAAGIQGLADHAEATLADPATARRRVTAFAHHAAHWDEAAMLRALFATLEDALASPAAPPHGRAGGRAA